MSQNICCTPLLGRSCIIFKLNIDFTLLVNNKEQCSQNICIIVCTPVYTNRIEYIYKLKRIDRSINHISLNKNNISLLYKPHFVECYMINIPSINTIYYLIVCKKKGSCTDLVFSMFRLLKIVLDKTLKHFLYSTVLEKNASLHCTNFSKKLLFKTAGYNSIKGTKK